MQNQQLPKNGQKKCCKMLHTFFLHFVEKNAKSVQKKTKKNRAPPLANWLGKILEFVVFGDFKTLFSVLSRFSRFFFFFRIFFAFFRAPGFAVSPPLSLFFLTKNEWNYIIFKQSFFLPIVSHEMMLQFSKI